MSIFRSFSCPHLPSFMLLASMTLTMGCESLINPFGIETQSKLPGQRLIILTQADRLQIDPFLSNSPYTPPAAQILPAWPVQQANSRHLIEHAQWNGSWTSTWSANIGETFSSEHPLQSTPVVAGNRVFATDNDYTVTSVDLTTGEEYWQFNNETDIEYTVSYGGGLAVGQGVLILTTGYGDVIALDALTGEEKWRVSLLIPIRGSATLHQNQAIIQTLDSQAFAFDISDGSEIWFHAGINEITSVVNQTSPASDGKRVFLAYNSGEIAAVDPETGEPLWLDALNSVQRSSELAQINTIVTSPIIINDALLVSGYGAQMVLFNASSGQRIWEQKIGTLHMPWISGNVIFVLSNDQKLYALDLFSGKLRWSIKPDEALHLYEKAQQLVTEEATEDSNPDEIVATDYARQFWSAPSLIDGHLQLLSSDGTILKLNPQSGKINNALNISAGSRLAPVIVNDTALIIEDNGTIHAFN